MQLRKLAALERQKIEDELKEIVKNNCRVRRYLKFHQKKIMDIVKSELAELKEKYGDERRTKVVKGRVGEISEEDLVVSEDCIITISDSGYIKTNERSHLQKLRVGEETGVFRDLTKRRRPN